MNRSNALCQIEAGELKGKVPKLKQGARTGAERQNWNRASELEQGVRTGAGRQNWSRASELEQGVRIGAGRQNWSRVIVSGEVGL